MIIRRSTLVLAVCATLVACSKKSKQAAEEAGDGGVRVIRPSASKGAHRGIERITIKEVRSLLTALPGARVHTPWHRARAGQRIDTILCVADRTPTVVGSALAAHIQTQGWNGAVVRPHPKGEGRLNVNASRPPYQLLAAVMPDRKTCPRGQRTRLRISIYKLSTSPSTR